jgi:polysaccharide deacetylase 2 family uncharacterized protein YibQ
MIAAVMMILADYFLYGGATDHIEKIRDKARVEYAVKIEEREQAEDLSPVTVHPLKRQAVKSPPVRVDPGEGKTYFEEEISEAESEKSPSSDKAAAPGAPVKIAIIIDDVGMNLKMSRRAIEKLPPEITLAILPYAPDAREMAENARKEGHHIIIHMPMEAMDGAADIGPMGLKTGMSTEEFDRQFGVMLDSFAGYEGINNHMGSRLTQDGPSMQRLMTLLKLEDLYFVDSRTIGGSVAMGAAKEAGIPYASRDVFLDHEETSGFAHEALKKAEGVARRRGYAIAIGHPKKETLKALEEWIPTLKEKNIKLVPVSDVLTRP